MRANPPVHELLIRRYDWLEECVRYFVCRPWFKPERGFHLPVRFNVKLSISIAK
jgi:hypothetical protein